MNSPVSDFSPQIQRRNLRTIFRTLIPVGLLSVLVFLALAYQTQNRLMLAGALNTLGLVLGFLFSAFLHRLGRTVQALWSMGIFISIAFITFQFFIQGTGWVLALLGFLFLANVALLSLDGASALGMILLSALGVSLGAIADALLPTATRLEAPALVLQTIIVLGGITLLILGISLLERFSFRSLRAQLTWAFLLIAIVPLWTTTFPSLISVRQSLIEDDNQILLKNAQDAAGEMDNLLNDLQSEIALDAQFLPLKNFLQGKTEAKTEALGILQVFVERNEFTISCGLLNANGLVVLDTQSYRSAQNEAPRGWFQQTMIQRSAYISELLYDPYMLRPALVATAPILEKDGSVLGLLRCSYDGQILQSELERQNSWLGESQTALLINQNGIVLAHSTSPAAQMQTLAPLSPEQGAALQQAGQLPPGDPASMNLHLTQLAKMLATPNRPEFFRSSLTPGSGTSSYITVVDLESKNWQMVFGRQGNQFSTQLSSLTNTTLLISLLVMLAVTAAGAFLARLVTTPINQLSQIAAEIGQGGLERPIRIPRRDEIGQLSIVMEETAHRLSDTMRNLEERVEERTRALSTLNAQSARRAAQLRALAEVARAVSSLKALDDLLPQITITISEAFGYYHAGIFLLDASKNLAILRAANSEGGQKMLARGHQLRVGQEGIVGLVTATGQPRIALDVGDDAVFFNNPDLPNTRSEIALPLKVGSEVIGALDVQSVEAQAFSNQDTEALGLLADQIAIAIQNARLFEDARKALSEAQTLFGQQEKGSWQAIGRDTPLVYRYYNGQVEALREGLPANSPQDGLLQLPISLRGEKLGSVQIRVPQQKGSWTPEEIRVYQGITERLAFALENARLFQDAQRLASKESLLSAIASRIGSSSSIESILSTTVRELSYAIPDSDIIIQLSPPKSAP